MKKIKKEFFFPVLILVICIILTSFKLNGSSIGMYSYIFYGDSRNDSVIFGLPQSIRSDEWFVQTPWTLSQYQANFSNPNYLYGNGIDFTTANLPIGNWTVLFRPALLSFFILPIEYAFSWMWWFRAAILILSAYVGLLITTKKITPSILLSLSLYFSPFVQWWYSTSVVEILSFGILMPTVFYLIINTKNINKLILFCFLFIYSSCCFAIQLYPPFQIPIVICIVFIIAGYLLNNLPRYRLLLDRKFIIGVAISFLFIGIFIVLYYLTGKDSITIIRQTVYPGQRRLVGGGTSPLLLFGGIYNYFLQFGPQGVPSGSGNQCEASTFLLISIFLLPIFIYYETKKIITRQKIDWIAISICLYMILMFAWCFFGLPVFIAKLTLLNFVQSTRTLSGWGIINLFAMAYFLYQYQLEENKQIDYKLVTFILTLCIVGMYAYFSLSLHENNTKIYPSNIYIFIVPVVIGFLIYSLVNRYKYPFLVIFSLVLLFSGVCVNPIRIGLKPILESDYSVKIQNILKRSNPEDKWVSYDSLWGSNYLAANGAHVINGTFLYPDLKLWEEFDTQNQYKDVYNRYSHIEFNQNDTDEIKITLKATDIFNVTINPCNPVFNKVGVKYSVFTHQVSLPCLKEIDHIIYPNQTIFIYQRIK